MVRTLFTGGRPPLPDLRPTLNTLKGNQEFASPIHLCNPLHVPGWVSGQPAGSCGQREPAVLLGLRARACPNGSTSK